MKLVGYTREQYDARARRGQLANPHEIPASQLLQPLHALLNVFQDELHAQLGMPLAHASRLAHDVKYWLVVGYEPDAEKRWSILVKSAHDLRSENHDPRLYDPRLNQLNHRPHVHDLPSNNHALRGGRGVIHVLAGGINGRDAGDRREWTSVCGTLDEILSHIENHIGRLDRVDRVDSVALVSLTRVAAKMSERADRHDIDLAEFWAKPARRERRRV